ncbi:hypothetical protein ML405_22115 (plasmid) [Escherichia coli]|nr:hypothetical protein [Escherichia coli]MCI3097121.1 hypothetical protein [Escherichia coli]
MWKIVSVCSIAMTCMLSPGIVCASQDSAAFIESLRDQSDMLRRQATVSRWFAEGYVLHLLIIAVIVYGLQT